MQIYRKNIIRKYILNIILLGVQFKKLLNIHVGKHCYVEFVSSTFRRITTLTNLDLDL